MHAMWKDMFVLGLPILEKILRPILVYLFLIIGLRLAGKRELAQLNAFDLVVLLTLSNTVQNAIIGSDYVVVRFFYTHERLDRVIEGDADVLIDDGQIKEDRCKKELITRAELEAAA